jgi:hypothetical protein
MAMTMTMATRTRTKRQTMVEKHLVGSVLLIFFSFLCCVFCSVCLFVVACVSNVASVCELSILYCPFGFLFRVVSNTENARLSYTNNTKTVEKLGCTWLVSSSCPTYSTCRITLVKNDVIVGNKWYDRYSLVCSIYALKLSMRTRLNDKRDDFICELFNYKQQHSSSTSICTIYLSIYTIFQSLFHIRISLIEGYC